ncbi:probable ATP-dependent RNA helicase DDX28 [Neocloeon triangulifer]|uniref:probable ATP-dependent RNA helicase DDX28 n=1 Tax=Neocloeon triangulifer TaxID=2078957 RepID=UPI00286F968A|nr:probable ATP-dependent RNA helicase DDX28 [Neocloeon triangulifer]
MLSQSRLFLLSRSLPFCTSSVSSRTMSWYIFNKLRDTSTIAPKTTPKSQERKVRKPKLSANSANRPKWDTKNWLIECKRPQFNLPKDIPGTVGGGTELASHAWFNRHANGDFFTIHPSEKPVEIQNTVSETFDDMKYSSDLISAVKNLSFHHPTLIQWKSAIPILEGKNTVIAAETGCGKTLAYLLPIMQQLIDWKTFYPEKLNTPLVLVLAPNRELVHQIYDVASQLAKTLPLTPVMLTGGRTKRLIMNPNFEPMDILIATPSVVSKLAATKVLDLSNILHVVLDEADTLMDDSFNWYIKKFLRKINIHFQSQRRHGSAPVGAQLTMVSATMPQDIGPILADFLDEDSFEIVTTPGLHKLMPQIKQTFLRMGKIHKPEELLKNVKHLKAQKSPTLIFSNKTATSRFVTLFLKEHNIEAPCFCAKMPAELRYETFSMFQSGETQFLSVTDIASRGLDTLKANVILNYDFPLFMADYLHRCGRVGRIGSQGSARVINFVNGPVEIKLVQAIEKSIRSQEPLPDVNGNIIRLLQEYSESQSEREFNMEIKQLASV